MKAIVLLNAAAGTLAAMNDDAQTRSVADALSSAGIDAEIRVVPSDQLSAEAAKAAASSVDVVIAGGGDGTLSTVAGALAGSAMPLGILPLGTLNHFAKDLNIPFDLNEAVRVIAAGNIATIDVADVNGRVFINNSSLGVYPRLVLDRESIRSRHGLSKWTAMAMAMLKVFHRFPMVEVRLATSEGTIWRKTPLVFVGNNIYDLDLLNGGTRARLNRGELSLYIANVQNRWGMLMLILRTGLGRLKQSRDFNSFALSSCSIKSRRRRLHVAVDGEVIRLSPPLDYQVQASALRVIVPESAPGQFPEAAP